MLPPKSSNLYSFWPAQPFIRGGGKLNIIVMPGGQNEILLLYAMAFLSLRLQNTNLSLSVCVPHSKPFLYLIPHPDFES